MNVRRQAAAAHLDAIDSYSLVAATPFARLGVATHDDAIVRVAYLPVAGPVRSATDALAREAHRQILAYLQNAAFAFDLPLRLHGSEFQLRVWREIARIPRGRTLTYGALAQRIGSAARPVGGACGSNPIPLIVPCHRVLAAGGRIGGFMHSVADHPLMIKRWLLDHEDA